MEIRFQSKLYTTPVPKDTEAPWLDKDTDKVKLVQDLRVVIDGILIIVPKGYITDGASVPRFFWRIYNPWCTEARRASCVHDFFYSHLWRSFDKEFADKALKEIMLKDGASKFMAWAFYRAVRLNFNGGGWNK